MKTTIELPDSLGRRAKMLAAERRTTLRALVVEGLERVMADGQALSKDRAEKLFAAMDEAEGITAAKRLNRNEANAR